MYDGLIKVELRSGVFLVRPQRKLFLNAGGPIQLTPKRTYKAFKTSYEIANQPRKSTIMILFDDVKGLRWFPVNESYAKNNFDFVSDSKLENQTEWLSKFRKVNEHIRQKGTHLTF